MQAVILAGGYGTRLSEETTLRPKPLVEIGGLPILWHIMKLYSHYGVNDFLICCGYKGYMIKEYFSNYFLHTSDVSFDMSSNKIQFLNSRAEQWKVTLIDTGIETMTGGRLKRIEQYLDKVFFLTYGDGLSNIDISKLHKFHQDSGKLATVTAVNPPGRFGSLNIDKDNIVKNFHEKPNDSESYINGGFFVLSKDVINYIDGDSTLLERQPMENLSHDKQLIAYKHKGFWQPMDTIREKSLLENLWNTDSCPWKIWND